MKTIGVSLPTFEDIKLSEKAAAFLLGLKKHTKTLTTAIFKKYASTKKFIFAFSALGLKRLRFNTASSDNSHSFTKKLSPFKRMNFGMFSNAKKFIRPLIYIGVIVVALLLVRGVFLNSGAQDSRLEVKGAKAVQELNKEFDFPLTDSDGNELSKIKYVIERAELRDEIIVEGKRATSVKGRTFLILTLRLTNEYSQAIKINTRDYVRVSVNGNQDEWMAPDVHNDPVEIQPISTKVTRLGLPINDSDTNLVVRVGEIDKEKEDVQLDF